VIGAGFKPPNGKPADYLTDNLDGSISGWSGSDTATTIIPGRGGGNLAAYTALEVGTSGGATYLYAANNITGTIDVYDTSFSKVALAGAFVDPGPNPDGLVPYNIENIGANLWVTYAVPGPSASAAPLGSGFVSVFNMDGTFVRRFTTGGMLSSPWGITIAPANFGKYSNDVLIGNFNDGPTEGFINAFDPTTGKRVGTLKQDNKVIVLPGLWAMQRRRPGGERRGHRGRPDGRRDRGGDQHAAHHAKEVVTPLPVRTAGAQGARRGRRGR
jgi:uncharacterized protein (TIGR03118 family)